MYFGPAWLQCILPHSLFLTEGISTAGAEADYQHCLSIVGHGTLHFQMEYPFHKMKIFTVWPEKFNPAKDIIIISSVGRAG